MRERAQRFDPRQHMHRPDFEVFHYRDPRPAGVEVHHHDFYEEIGRASCRERV